MSNFMRDLPIKRVPRKQAWYSDSYNPFKSTHKHNGTWMETITASTPFYESGPSAHDGDLEAANVSVSPPAEITPSKPAPDILPQVQGESDRNLKTTDTGLAVNVDGRPEDSFSGAGLDTYAGGSVTVSLISEPKDIQGHITPTLNCVRVSFHDTLPSNSFRLRDKLQDSDGIILLVVEGWNQSVERWFETDVPNFPPALARNANRGGASMMMLPYVSKSNAYGQVFKIFYLRLPELSSCMNHINVFKASNGEYSPGALHLGSYEARHLPLATWLSSSHWITSDASRGIIVICGPPGFDYSMIMHHYNGNGMKRWNRLRECPFWISLDMFYLFTSWDRTLTAAQETLAPIARQLYGMEKASSILKQTRIIHKNTATTLAINQTIRLHLACFKRLQRGLLKIPDTVDLKELKDRFEDVVESLEYYGVTGQSIIDHQENLLSLTFNTETVLQGNAVARINALAFIFLPLSFVASIFGMTTFSGPVHWYPLAAIPVLLCTIFIAYAINKIVQYNECHEKTLLQFIIESLWVCIRRKPIIKTLRSPEQLKQIRLSRKSSSAVVEPSDASNIPTIITTAATMKVDSV
ncbi:hypothetical protein BP6252_14024 [Coleophoma cylindrospora]|uniref:Uncharacterized protein n=1 Tax=Coleophoma cylindrospora TaxID=1849047 RepID=A0A3D8Q4F2_9HELO|nr:hypothetical protein BP6252_14024 [Coleophoma cylindrospora]